VYAKESGIPFRKLIVAANENDVLNDFMRTGVYDIRQRSLIKTSSPSIDILKSSNLERMLYIIEKDPSKIAQYFADLAKHNYFKVSDQTLHKLQCVYFMRILGLL
jgi:threonine synthase